MNANQPVRVGFIGAGAICADRHLPHLAKIDGVELIAVCNRSRASSEAVARGFGFAAVETDYRALLERDDVDAVFIGTWPYMHREMSVAALEQGKHVFCQARMCRDWDEAVAMGAAAGRHPDRVAMLCPPPHRMPWEPAIVDLVGSGRLGELRHVEVRSLGGSNLDPDSISWRERVEFSGIQFLACGIVAETLNAWVGEYESLGARTSIPLGSKNEPAGGAYEIRIPQVAAIHGRLTCGATISEIHSGLHGAGDVDEVTITGAAAALRVRFMKSIEWAPAGEPFRPLEVAADRLRDWRVEEDFIAAVRAARRGDPWSVDPGFRDGLRYMRKMQAVADSAAAGGRPIVLADEYAMA